MIKMWVLVFFFTRGGMADTFLIDNIGTLESCEYVLRNLPDGLKGRGDGRCIEVWKRP